MQSTICRWSTVLLAYSTHSSYLEDLRERSTFSQRHYLHFPGLGVYISERVYDMRKVVRRQILRIIMPLINSPVMLSVESFNIPLDLIYQLAKYITLRYPPLAISLSLLFPNLWAKWSGSRIASNRPIKTQNNRIILALLLLLECLCILVTASLEPDSVPSWRGLSWQGVLPKISLVPTGLRECQDMYVSFGVGTRWPGGRCSFAQK